MLRSDEEGLILEFLKQEALQGRFESTTREIANGTHLGYNRVGRILERLLTRDEIRCRERKRVPYYYLIDILVICQERWKNQESQSTTTKNGGLSK